MVCGNSMQIRSQEKNGAWTKKSPYKVLSPRPWSCVNSKVKRSGPKKSVSQVGSVLLVLWEHQHGLAFVLGLKKIHAWTYFGPRKIQNLVILTVLCERYYGLALFSPSPGLV